MAEVGTTGGELKDQVISINRVTKVVKGGKNLSFSALVVVGDQQGRVGYGMGKAKEVPAAIKKGVDKAKRGLIEIPMSGSTVPHAVMGAFGSGRVMIKPAKEGTGVIAGGPVRGVAPVAQSGRGRQESRNFSRGFVMAKGDTLRIKYVRSSIGRTEHQKRIVRSLGLRKLNQVVEREDTPAVRGVVAKIPHLIQIVGSEEK
jgi:small subunit ribosomal protein S5